MSCVVPETDANEMRVIPLAEISTAEIVSLVRRSLGVSRVPRTQDFWIWKHRSGPFGPSPGLAAVDGQGRLIGLRAFLPWLWRSGDRTWRAVRAVDTATDPSWRRRGIFRRLTLELMERLRDDGAAFIFNTPNRFSLDGYLEMGWYEVGRIPLLICPLLPWRRRTSAGSFLEPASAALATLEDVPNVGRLGGSSERLETPIDPDFLAWRYARPPGLDYRVSRACADGTVALVICHLRRRGRMTELALADFLASPGIASEALVRRTLRRTLARAPAHYAVASAPPGTAERRLLIRAGFLPVPHLGPRLAVRPLIQDPELPDLKRWDTWRTVLGDLELF